jgi:hypothetical protein
MKSVTGLRIMCCLALIGLGGVAPSSYANPKEEMKGPGMGADHDAMMAKWQEMSTPNENHKALDVLVGHWDHSLKWWMSPDAPPDESTGTTQTTWILGGRFIKHMAQGTSMGQPFEGMGIIGYDNGKKEYNMVWIDNMGTGFMTASGQYDPASKTFTEKGQISCPIKGQMPFRGVTKIIDNDHYTYELYAPGEDGKEFRSMEIRYTRSK